MDRLRVLFDILGKRHLNSDLARRLGVPRMRLSRWRRGPTCPDAVQCRVIVEFAAEQMYPGRPEEQRDIVADMLRWVRGEAMPRDEETKIASLIAQQLIEAPNAIEVLRTSLGLRVKDAARRLGISRQSLHVWEHSEATPERLESCRRAWKA